MIAALRAVPGWAWVALLLAAALGVQQVRYSDLRADLAEQGRQHEAYVASVEKATSKAQADARAKEKQLVADNEKVRENARQEIDRYSAAADRSDARAAGLQQQLNGLRAKLAGIAGVDPAAAGGGTAAHYATVLADLLGRANDRARRLSKDLDRSRTAGLACEAAYDSVRASNR